MAQHLSPCYLFRVLEVQNSRAEPLSLIVDLVSNPVVGIVRKIRRGCVHTSMHLLTCLEALRKVGERSGTMYQRPLKTWQEMALVCFFPVDSTLSRLKNSSCADSLIRHRGDKSVSYLPVRFPHWAELPSDPKPYHRPSPVLQKPPSPLLLASESHCSCGGVCKFDLNLPVILRECRVYTINTYFDISIELQACPSSHPTRRRFIGPDLRELGLFNYNNFIIFSHDLLDDYTSAFCTSETPFVAWVTVVSRRYQAVSLSFVGEDLFRSVWFLYVKLQHFPGDMVCTLCGPHPQTIIWDGVTLAFGKKKVLNSIRPPTVSGSGAQTRSSVKYQPKQQLIKDAGLRKRIREMLNGPQLTPANDDGSGSDEEMDEIQPASKASQHASGGTSESTIAFVELVDGITLELDLICQSLSDLVRFYFAPTTSKGRFKIPSEYKNFLRQV